MGASPPGPFWCGSTTSRTKPAATPPSNAFPPRSSMPTPVWAASQWVAATIPWVPASSGRVVKPGGVTGSAYVPQCETGTGGYRVRWPDEVLRGTRAYRRALVDEFGREHAGFDFGVDKRGSPCTLIGRSGRRLESQ